MWKGGRDLLGTDFGLTWGWLWANLGWLRTNLGLTSGLLGGDLGLTWGWRRAYRMRELLYLYTIKGLHLILNLWLACLLMQWSAVEFENGFIVSWIRLLKLVCRNALANCCIVRITEILCPFRDSRLTVTPTFCIIFEN